MNALYHSLDERNCFMSESFKKYIKSKNLIVGKTWNCRINFYHSGIKRDSTQDISRSQLA